MSCFCYKCEHYKRDEDIDMYYCAGRKVHLEKISCDKEECPFCDKVKKRVRLETIKEIREKFEEFFESDDEDGKVLSNISIWLEGRE